MSPSVVRQVLYGSLSMLGLVLTWHQNLAWLDERTALSPIPWTLIGWEFGRDAFFGGHVSASLAWDALLCELAAIVWATHESRRIGMSRWWGLIFFVLATLIAVAFTLGLFLFLRERHLAKMQPAAVRAA